MRRLELRRHAQRDPSVDRLSAKGRAQAEDLGRSAALSGSYTNVFVSPAVRAAETAAWILRGAHGMLPPEHAVIHGLAGKDPGAGSPESMAAGVRALLDQVPEGGRGLAISHTPFVEHAAFGLTGREPAPFAECEGILVTLRDDGTVAVEELRVAGEVA
jgi:phosphohistidine phosphatase SixA